MAIISPSEFLKVKPTSTSPQSTVSVDKFLGGGNFKVVKKEMPEEKELGFLQRVGQDMQNRTKLLEQISDATSGGEQTFAEGVLQTVGKVGVGGFFDILGEGLVSGVRTLSKITPDFIEKPLVDNVKKGVGALLNTEIGKAGLDALSGGIELYDRWKGANPRAARNLEAVVDIALLASPTKKAPIPVAKPIVGQIGKVGERLVVSGERKIISSRVQFIDDLVRPSQTKVVREAQVARTIEEGVGLGKKKVILPSVREKAVAAEVSKIAGVSPKNTLQGNYNMISGEAKRLAAELEENVVKNDFIFPKKELKADLNRAKARVMENPTIVGDSEKVAQKLITQFMKMVDAGDKKGSSLLETRKKFDTWVKTQKGTSVFDPKNENAFSISLREIRQTVNNFLEIKAPKAEVKESLRRQSNLYSAMDNIAPKAADEASTTLMRTWQDVSRILSVKSSIVQSLALVAGIGGLGAAAVFAPFVRNFLFSITAAVGIRKVILAPNTRIFLGKLLQGVDVALQKTKDADLIRQLRLDRALIVEILEQDEEKD